jgi:SAM-dependent methyltransferase
VIPESYFDRFDTPKYRSRNPVQRALIRRFIDRLHGLFVAANPVRAVLEVGVGEGFISGFLSERFPEVSFSGADVSERDLARLGQKFPRIRTHCTSIYDLASIGQRFDLVICAEVLEHVDDPARALAALVGVGPEHLILTVPHEPWFLLSNLARGKNLTRLGNDPEHLQLFGRRKFRRLLERELVVEELATSYPWLLALARPRQSVR